MANKITKTILDLYPERITITKAGCWLWHKLNKCGYPCMASVDAVIFIPHRLSCTLDGKEIEGLDVDHLCRVRACVNPKHLEPVTHAENIRRSPFARKIACKHGHVFSKENTVIRTHRNGRKQRVCLTCQKKKYEERYRTKKREIIAQVTKYQRANKDKQHGWAAKRRREHKDEILAYQRAWYAKNGRKKSHQLVIPGEVSKAGVGIE